MYIFNENIKELLLDINKTKFLDLLNKLQIFSASVTKKIKNIELFNCDKCSYYIITINNIKNLKGIYKQRSVNSDTITQHYDCQNIEKDYFEILKLFDIISSSKLMIEFIGFHFIQENGIRFVKDSILLNCLKLALKIDVNSTFKEQLAKVYYDLGFNLSKVGLNTDVVAFHKMIEQNNRKISQIESIQDFVKQFVSELSM